MICPNCHDANSCGDYEGSTCEVCMGKGHVMPKRIQRKRTKGWRIPPNTVSVCRPGRYGNPFPVAVGYDAAAAVRDFRSYVVGRLSNGTGYPLAALRGKNLACFCALDQPCHADVLLELANVTGGDVGDRE